MNYTAAVIGLGQIGLMYDFDPKRQPPSSHCLAYEQDSRFHLIAAADLQTDKEHKLKSLAPNARFYVNYKEMLNDIPHLDAISICTPASQHLQDLDSILEISPPSIIFCEKPIATDTWNARKILTLVRNKSILIIPNLTRRFLRGMQEVHKKILSNDYGEIQKIDARYTRGIYNTGAHLFDLIRWFAGEIEEVMVVGRTTTSSDIENEPTYSFVYHTNRNVNGFVEAFDDRQYYLFELDLYFESGKIEIRNSGDVVNYYQAGAHLMFTGFKALHREYSEENILSESALKNAIRHLGDIITSNEIPLCKLVDGIQPLFVAEALQQSAHNNSWVKVEVEGYE